MKQARWTSAALCALAALASAAAASAQGAPPAQAPAGSGPAPYGGMQAGGLAPPPPLPPQGAPGGAAPSGNPTEKQLDEAKKEDSGRGLEWVWLNVEGGFETVGLQTFSVSEKTFTAGFVPSTASGGMVGAGLGLRLLFLTLGARGRLGFFGPYQIYSLGGELGAHIPLGRVEPHFDLGFGYAAMGSFGDLVSGVPDPLSISGFYGRLGLGLDVYVTPVFSIGANVSGQVLGLTRASVSPSDLAALKQKLAQNPSVANAQQLNADALSANGTSYGGSLAVTGVLGLHF